MRAVVQRVRSASVSVAGEHIAEIGAGLVVLLGVGAADHAEDGERLAHKIGDLRILADDAGRMNRSAREQSAPVLVVPQFTLYADLRHGRRPDFTTAAPPELGRRLFEVFCGSLRAQELRVASGRFGAHMEIDLVADGPVTIVASTDAWPEAEIGLKGTAHHE